jgi:hypothetical protein
MMDNVQKKTQIIMHHRQNPLDFMNLQVGDCKGATHFGAHKVFVILHALYIDLLAKHRNIAH